MPVFDLLRWGPRKWPIFRQKLISSKPSIRIMSDRLQPVSLGLKSTGYFFGATRKDRCMIFLEDTFGRIQIRAPAWPPNWPPATTFWPKSSKRGDFSFFRFARSNHLKKPVLPKWGPIPPPLSPPYPPLIWGSGQIGYFFVKIGYLKILGIWRPNFIDFLSKIDELEV